MFIGQQENIEFGRGRDRKKRKRRGKSLGFRQPLGTKPNKSGLRKAASIAGKSAVGAAALYGAVKNRKAIGNVAKAGVNKAKSGLATANMARKIAQTNRGVAKAKAARQPFQANSAQSKAVSKNKATKRDNQRARIEKDLYAGSTPKSRRTAKRKADNRRRARPGGF